MSGFRLTPQGRLKLSENDVEKACIDLLQRKHFYPLRLQSAGVIYADRPVIAALKRAHVPYRWGTIGEPGIPDYVIPRFFVETKAPGGILSDIQRKKIYELDRYWDLETLVVESVEELIECLKQREESR